MKMTLWKLIRKQAHFFFTLLKGEIITIISSIYALLSSIILIFILSPDTESRFIIITIFLILGSLLISVILPIRMNAKENDYKLWSGFKALPGNNGTLFLSKVFFIWEFHMQIIIIPLLIWTLLHLKLLSTNATIGFIIVGFSFLVLCNIFVFLIAYFFCHYKIRLIVKLFNAMFYILVFLYITKKLKFKDMENNKLSLTMLNNIGIKQIFFIDLMLFTAVFLLLYISYTFTERLYYKKYND